ncbi:hypothetical protein UT300005_05540 [Clostridium sp. CTA-5]
MKNEKNTHLNKYIYFIIFLILLISTIYCISRSIGNSNIVIQSNQEYTKDQIDAINAVADSTVSKINNIIAVTAIFFTIIVASISFFQFIKMKDIDEVVKRAENLEKSIESSKFQIKKLNIEYEKMNIMRENLELITAKTQMEFNIHKIADIINTECYYVKDIIEIIDKTIELDKIYPNILDNYEKAKLYYRKGLEYNKMSKKQSLTEFYKALNYMKTLDMHQIVYLNFTEQICRDIIEIERSNENIGNVKELINNMRDIIEHWISDKFLGIEAMDFDMFIDTMIECSSYYEELSKKELIKLYQDGYLSRFEKYKNFKELMEEILKN